MATVYQCDGCDEHIKNYSPEHDVTRVGIANGNEKNLSLQTFDLCGRCKTRFYDQINPSKWHRAPERVACS